MLIASDLPLQGANRALTTEMADAIEFVLAERDWEAGGKKVGYQSCDDSTAQAGSWDSAKCSSNARAYADNENIARPGRDVQLGLRQAGHPGAEPPRGPAAMVSPANTYPGLTEGGPGTEAGEPDNYYPTGERNYARVVWNDQFQGAANALYAQELGLKNVFVLNDKRDVRTGHRATSSSSRRRSSGSKIAGNQKLGQEGVELRVAWPAAIKASGADGIFLGGIICNNGGKLIKDLKAALPDTQILGPDGWTPIDATIDGAGPAADGMYISQPGIPTDQLTGGGKEFVDAFKAASGKDTVDPYTAYAAQAAVVLLEAIDRADGDRTKVARGAVQHEHQRRDPRRLRDRRERRHDARNGHVLPGEGRQGRVRQD